MADRKIANITAPPKGGSMPKNNPNANSRAAGAKGVNRGIKPSGKKGGGVKIPRTRATSGKKGSGYNR
jgi:hypothetical protein